MGELDSAAGQCQIHGWIPSARVIRSPGRPAISEAHQKVPIRLWEGDADCPLECLEFFAASWSGVSATIPFLDLLLNRVWPSSCTASTFRLASLLGGLQAPQLTRAPSVLLLLSSTYR